MSEDSRIKVAIEIGALAGKLTPNNQFFVLNTINILLFAQNSNEAKQEPKQKTG